MIYTASSGSPYAKAENRVAIGSWLKRESLLEPQSCFWLNFLLAAA